MLNQFEDRLTRLVHKSAAHRANRPMYGYNHLLTTTGNQWAQHTRSTRWWIWRVHRSVPIASCPDCRQPRCLQQCFSIQR